MAMTKLPIAQLRTLKLISEGTNQALDLPKGYRRWIHTSEKQGLIRFDPSTEAWALTGQGHEQVLYTFKADMAHVLGEAHRQAELARNSTSWHHSEGQPILSSSETAGGPIWTLDAPPGYRFVSTQTHAVVASGQGVSHAEVMRDLYTDLFQGFEPCYVAECEWCQDVAR